MNRSDESKRRDAHEIIVTLLKVARKGAKKTWLLYRANLSHEMLSKYLGKLNSGGFLEQKEINGEIIWKTTEKGIEVIEACEICHQLIQELRT